METYSSYKNSNVSWIGMIPEHWETYIFKRLIKYRKAGSWGSEPKTSEIDCTCLRIADFDYDKFRFQRKTDNTIRSYKWKELEDRILKQGDILIEKSGGGEKTPVGRAILYDLNINNAMYANFMEKIAPKESLVSKFLVYILSLMYSRRAIWTYVKYTTGIQNLDLTSMLSNEKIPVPPLAEQEKIVSYLESKTSKIDAYVADKEKEIQLLQELKQKTIAEAVTKGLNPNVKMKDSGISWLGMIPEHWEMKQLRSFLSLFTEKGHGDAQLLSVTREQGVILRDKDNKEENHNFVPEDLSGYKYIEKGDFAINKMKAWQGSYAVSDYNGIVSPAYFTCKLKGVNKDFFSRAIRSKAYIPFFTQYSKGIRVDQWDLNPNALKSIPFLLPPVDEQQAIVSYIEEKCQKIDTLITELQAEINFLKEYKQRLIADVVTGQVNVQNETI